MRRIFFTSFLIIVCSLLYAQDAYIDSLKRELKNTNQDTSKIKILLQLVENISDDKIWPLYNEQMLKLSGKLAINKNPKINLLAKKALADAYNKVGFIYNSEGDIPVCKQV